ncbi:beta-glucosidase [uncultured Cellulomonas sp.]|uniref:beta-glucosidase family protein n=1 Tax=uncultured Cellulomonas sp. TaxID=189682 RepID=UPI00262CB1C3|nr:glycoside hydrolase family 3 C-terminal domain-containing protein [uncultured Cellulomonas sp.]
MDATPTTTFDSATGRVRAGEAADDVARDLYAELTEAERLDLLDGDTPFWPGMAEILFEGYNTRPIPMGAVERLGIPGLLFADGPRGMVVGHSTAFPVAMARGATWDVELEERIGEVIGAEGRVQGANFFGGVCINLPRHPAWGRVQETYGEDPVLLGELGAALARGAGRHLMACVKHYALNSMENARFSVDVQVDEATLHEFYLPHFRRVIEAGAPAVMSAYNSVNGEWAGQNADLLTRVLRDDWGFEGVVITDFIWGMRDGTAALRAGLDVEAPFRQQRGAHLADDLAAGRAGWDDVERAGLRTLAAQLRLYAGRTAAEPTEPVAGPAHRALAREAAQRSMVLLRNQPVGGSGSALLPLHAPDLRRVTVLGRLADLPNTGDRGSSDVRAPSVVTPLEGLRDALPDADVVHVAEPDPRAAARAAADSDVAVVVVGYTAADEGEFVGGDIFGRPELTALYPEPETDADRELQRRMTQAAAEGLSMAGSEDAGGDRADLHLRPEDVELIRAVAAANPRTVVAVVAAGTVLMDEWQDDVPAIVLAWYSGMEGGAALADLLLGAVDASGRLPFCIPTSADHLPDFDRDATSVTYDRWFGQRRLEHFGLAPAYPLGFGLSYTTVAVEVLDAARDGEEGVVVLALVRNTGHRDGRHVVQVYGRAADGERFLLGFAPVAVAAGEAVEVTVPASLRPLGRWDGERREIRVPQGPYPLEVGSYWGDPQAVGVEV